MQFDETPPSVRGAPEHGEHTDEVLLELGLTYDEIIEHKVTRSRAVRTDFESVDFFRDDTFIPDPYPYFDYLREQCPGARASRITTWSW